MHGDWAAIDDDGFWYILGRSDDTIKVAGKRLGPAEVESAAVAHPAVAEAAAVGVPHAVKGEAIAVFVVLRPGVEPTDAAARGDSRRGHEGARPRDEARVGALRHALPKTRNGKVLRRLIRARHLGKTNLGDTSSLESPEALEAIGQAR